MSGGGANAPGWARRVGLRVWRTRWLRWYLVLLIASHVVVFVLGARQEKVRHPNQTQMVTVAQGDGEGRSTGGSVELEVLRWGAEGAGAGGVPVVLLHGSPSRGAADFLGLGPALGERGREAVAVSLPGFGRSGDWVGDYSVRANARLALNVMDELGVERAHVVGWSLGGGSAIWMAELAPERVASLTLMASIGVQEAEGSGSYYFEHAKYALGYVGLVVLPEFVPHFGLLGERSFRHAFIRNFWDTDQRPLRGVMEGLETPTLILQGREDFLLSAWTAEESHRVIEPSRLVMYDAGHFLPTGSEIDGRPGYEVVAEEIAAFAGRHDVAGVAVQREYVDHAPVEADVDRTIGGVTIARDTPWWLVILIIMLGCKVSEDLTVIATGLLVSAGIVDIGVGLIGCFLGIFVGDMALWAVGRFLGRRILNIPWFRKRLPERSLAHWQDMLDKHTVKAVFLSRMLPGTRVPMYVAAGMLGRRPFVFIFWFAVAVAVWTPVLLGLTMLVGPPVLSFVEGVVEGPVALIVSIVIVLIVIKVVSYEATGQGRARLKADLRKLTHREFWPAWVFYLPLVPWYVWLALRHRGLMVWTAANPAIENGGGVVGESKTRILRSIEAPAGVVLHAELVEADEDVARRVARAKAVVAGTPELGGYPVIMKPDQAQRGMGVWVVEREEQIEDYFELVTGDVQIQRYHAGPHEVGVLWSRVPEASGRIEDWEGELFSITCKTFPLIEGDGELTLEELIWKHPRYSVQAKVFLHRHGDELDRVLGEGERFRLAEAGNHAQGTMFTDGAHLITPELTRAIDRLMRTIGVEGPEGGRGEGFDFGRLDARFASEDDLRRGEGFAIVEVNGTMSESTNLYDPTKSIWWSYGVLFRQWSRLFALGRARARGGHVAVSVGRVLALIRAQKKRHRQAVVSD